jgi:exodeoxyribonuclease VII large subunit
LNTSIYREGSGEVNSLVRQRPHAVQTVSQITARIRGLLESEFSDIAVTGEVSNLKIHSSGHWYFSLKDRLATLPCACFRAANSTFKFELEDGLKIVAYGKIDVYPPKGGYQMIVGGIEPVGIGQWQLAFEQLKEKLEKEGALAASRKRAIPVLPRKIGIVTSPAAAALHDILTALNRRNKTVPVVISPTRVQGDGTASEIAAAIRDVQQVPDVDVVIIARGGGSVEDLWSFNTEAVARAILNCRVPVISGVGHETDVTICDLVADLRAPTPTAAAELVSFRHTELVDRSANLKGLLINNMEQILVKAQRTVERLNPRLALLRQVESIKKLHLHVDRNRLAIERIMQDKLTSASHRLNRNDEKLNALSPLKTLGRGYAIIRFEDGKVVDDYSQVKPGDALQAWLKKGKLKLRVESSEQDW